MKRIFIFLATTVMGTASIFAQANSSYEEFRKSMLGDYQRFRNTVLQNYDKYLDGIWEEYQSFRGETRQSVPKPSIVPTAQPEQEATPIIQPAPQIVPEGSEIPTPSTVPIATPKPIIPTIPSASNCRIQFFGMSTLLPAADISVSELASMSYGKIWRTAQSSNLQRTVIPALQAQSAAWQLNDWFILELVRAYINQQFTSTTPNVRTLLECYLLSYMGYDIRLAEDEHGKPMLLANLKQKVYARSFLSIKKATYYTFYDDEREKDAAGICSLRTCQLPSDESLGKPFDLLIRHEMQIPFSSHAFSFTYEGLHIEGELNTNLMSMYYHYPQMEISSYAASTVSVQLHNRIIDQLKEQLQGLSQEVAVNKLIHFVQSAFKYATDEKQHGFEKPYFFEETLYYPQCDCEDRAIFYADLLWNVLHVENQIVSYPGHEAVAVHLNTDINGDGYIYKGKHYYISDPTYIGANTGMCMPNYKHSMPTVDYHWH